MKHAPAVTAGIEIVQDLARLVDAFQNHGEPTQPGDAVAILFLILRLRQPFEPHQSLETLTRQRVQPLSRAFATQKQGIAPDQTLMSDFPQVTLGHVLGP